jgi:hypothetical protein
LPTLAGDAPALQFLNLLKSWALTWVGTQQRFPTENARTLRFKEGAQFIREK